MATIAQGLQAGQLANGLTSLQTFTSAIQAALTANATIYQFSIGINGVPAPVSINLPLSVTDSATFLNAALTLAGQLSTEWTNQLAAL